MFRAATVVVMAASSIALGACGDSDDVQTVAPPTIGTGAVCTGQLAQAVTPEFLRQRGIGVSNPQVAQAQLTRAVAAVCRQGPATLTVSQGAERVAEVIKQGLIQKQRGRSSSYRP